VFDLATCRSSSPRLVEKPEALNSLARVLRPSGHPLILHGLSREKAIAIHSGGRTPIQTDLLPPGEQTGWMLMRAGFGDV
jgi:ubiquinone/menaquinone biosynthesis C-methylase UbiE